MRKTCGPLAVVRLRRHLKGFSLVRDQGDKVVVAHLYGLLRASDLDRLAAAERIFGHGLNIEQALQEVVVRAESMGYRVSVCGDRRREPVLRVWQQQEQRPESDVRVRLPGGQWPADGAVWERWHPGLWARLDGAFRGSGPRVAARCTSPVSSLEGKVVFRKGGADVFLVVRPASGGTTEPEPACAGGDVKRWFDGLVSFGPSGGQASGTISARRFTTLMRRLEALLNQLQGEVGAAADLAGLDVVAEAGD